jgi:hemerythrin-like domain-containing protein
MEPTAVLRHEHELVCRALAGADALAEAARAGHVDVRGARSFVEFARGFTDGCHHTKEERLLFPLVVERDPRLEAGPVAAMLHEHEGGRERIRRLDAALDAVEGGDDGAAADVAENLAAYAALLRAHIAKENNVLFPMAERVLTEQDERELEAAFERVELEETGPGEHERFARIAEELGGDATCAS